MRPFYAIPLNAKQPQKTFRNRNSLVSVAEGVVFTSRVGVEEHRLRDGEGFQRLEGDFGAVRASPDPPNPMSARGFSQHPCDKPLFRTSVSSCHRLLGQHHEVVAEHAQPQGRGEMLKTAIMAAGQPKRPF